MDIREYMELSIDIDYRKLEHYRKIINGVKLKGILIKRSSKNRKSVQFYYKDPGKSEKYLGRAKIKTINALQRKRIAEEMVKVIKHNIEVKRLFCENIENDNITEIVKRIPKAYQPEDYINEYDADNPAVKRISQSENPYHREELNIKTSFGLYVRSKSELQIAELLYSLGIEFYYERALRLEVFDGESYYYKTYFPDFTVILPDGSKVIWEHKGMLSVKEYVNRDIEKEIIYNMNGIYQSHNYIVTADGPHNNLDMEGITRIVTGWLMPLMCM